MEANVSSQLVVMTKDDLDAALNNAAMRMSSSNKPTQQALLTSKEVQSLGKVMSIFQGKKLPAC